MQNFEPRRFSPHVQFSGKLAAPAIYGLAVGFHPTDPESFALATPTSFAGFLLRAVVTAHTFPTDYLQDRKNLELPDLAGSETTAVPLDEVEAEGAEYIVLTGARALSNDTVTGTPVTFNGAGQFMLASGADAIFYRVANTARTGGLTPVTAAAVRIRFEKAA